MKCQCPIWTLQAVQKGLICYPALFEPLFVAKRLFRSFHLSHSAYQAFVIV